MADQFSRETRSKIMARIKGKNTQPEIKIRKELWKMGLKGFRTNYKLAGKPDIVFSKEKVAIFIDGDFWHGYSWKILRKIPPKGYWRKKIAGNIKRDGKYTKLLKEQGWKVLRFWEHDIDKNLDSIIRKIFKYIK